MYLSYKIRLLKFTLGSLTVIRFLHILAAYSSIWLSRIFSNPVVWGLPFASSIEPTTRCNLSCPECPTGMGLLKRPKGDLLFDQFKLYLNSLSKHTSYLTLYVQGEPFLNKSLPQMINYATQKRIFTTVSTNGHFLSVLIAEDIIKAGLKKIIISLDGANQASYAQYRKNGDFDKVTEGIKNLSVTRIKIGANNPLIVIQFIVFRHNENEILEIKELGRKIGADMVEIKTAQHYNLKADNDLITTRENFNRYEKGLNGNWILKNPGSKGCSRLWTTSVITWDGKVAPCCYDKDAEFSFGSLNSSSLKEIWKSSEYMKFRKKILSDKRTVKICCNCGEK